MTKKINPGVDKIFVTFQQRLGENAYFRDPASNIVYTGEALELAMMLRVRRGRDRKAEEELKDVMGVLPSDQAQTKPKGRRKPRRKQ